MRPEVKRSWPLLALLLAVASAYADALRPSRTFYDRDILGFWYPYVESFVRAVASGDGPLWNRYFGFGEPLLAVPNISPAYPPTWFNLILSPSSYYELLVVGHAIWAAVGAWRFARAVGLSNPSAVVAGLGFGIGGPLISTANLFHHFVGASFVPWVLLGIHAAAVAPGRRSALGLGLAVGGQVLSGSADMCLMSGLLAFAVIPGRLAEASAGGRRTPALLTLGAGAVLGLALSAIQWLPTAALLPGSHRAFSDPRSLAIWSVHPASLADVVVPRFVSDLPIRADLRQDLADGREPLLQSLYAGPVLLGLVALALVRRATRGQLGWALLLALTVALALGHHAPLHGWLATLPGFGMVRYPAKFFLPAAFCIALLAGSGVEVWRRPASEPDRRRGRRLAATASFGAVLIAATAFALLRWPALLAPVLAVEADPARAAVSSAWKLSHAGAVAAAWAALAAWRFRHERAPWASTPLLVALVGLDLVVAGCKVNDLAPLELVRYRPATIATLERDGARRIHSVASLQAECREVVQGPPGWSLRQMWMSGEVDRLRPPLAARWGLFGSFDGEFTGLGRAADWPVTIAAWSLRDTEAGARLLRIAGVTHVVWHGPETVHPPGMTEVGRVASAFACPVRVFRIDRTLPWVYVVGAERAGDDVGALLDPRFDPLREVLIAGGTPAGNASGFRGRAWVVEERANSVVVDLEVDRPGRLVLLEAFASGWRATVDGNPRSIERANALFRSVAVPAGRHRVRFAYRPTSVMLGAVFSCLGLLVAVALARHPSRPWPW